MLPTMAEILPFLAAISSPCNRVFVQELAEGNLRNKVFSIHAMSSNPHTASHQMNITTARKRPYPLSLRYATGITNYSSQ